MFKKYRIVKWILTVITLIVVILVSIGIYIASLLPEEDETLINSQASNITYITKDVPAYRGKILAVVTSTDTMGTSGKGTGYELTELARAYYVFKANGFDVDIASPLGGKPPVVLDDDDMGIFDYAFLNDSIAQSKTNNSLLLKDVKPEIYEAVYFVGGKGAMFDFPNNRFIHALIQDFHKNNKVIGAVCHGPAAFVNITLDDGQSFLKNKQVSSFTNKEELLLIPDAASVFPFLLQDELISQGAVFNEGIMYLEKISYDNNLITGQNPWSVWAMAEAMVKQLGYIPKNRAITGEENAVKVLFAYETKGKEDAKAVIKQIVEDKKQSVSRSLLVSHSAVSVIQGDLKKSYDLLRLASYTKDIELDK
ncbi:ThiJ/PfpI domain-containing protein [Allomuricauda ruestringensis DSM 13258]|uniref:ThiJ/PfpI domain-containing protein n=1 Tax=Allomuricauda ruestringensis (strain DSM 13258 / CIP 107369 / LMG 19739 / B1) TaxID=886377 RepID=G2PIB8_ALLRU|nr:type 1 glutamine amidotransferase domain-containing protein [Allomuricauda ruestringensis]AEM71736.1 ThiJ/PfpI domain-containing protein [Allomuricauda ruestringensis DSM 13258]